MIRKSRYRAATVLVAVVLLLGGLGMLSASLSAAQSKMIQGVVTKEGEPTTLLEGVTVTLFDAHGQKDPLVALTGPDGKYTFTPGPGFYHITARTGNFFDNRTDTFRFDGTANLLRDVEMEEMPEAIHDLTVHVEDDIGAGLDGALVEVYNVTPERTQLIVAGTTNGAFARPDSDVSNDTDGDTNDWMASTGTFLYAVMDETIPDESDYTVSPAANGDQGFEVGLSDVADPQASDDHVMRYRYRRTTGSFQTIDLDAELRQGSTVIAGWSHIGVDSAWVTAEQTLTQGQADSITDYTDLRVRFISTRDDIFGGTALISWAELEVPLATGNVTFTSSLWTGDFEIRTSKESFETDVTTVAVSGDTVVVVSLDPGIELVGIAREPDWTFIEDGLVAYLYNNDTGTDEIKRLIAANVSGSSYTFHAFTGNYTLIVDADGKAANITPLFVHSGMTPEERRIDRILDLSPEERVNVGIEYSQDDWNNLSLRRTLNLNYDSGIPGLPLSDLRDLRLQIDIALGDGDGILSQTEINLFRDWLLEAGPKFVDTQNLFDTDSQSYRSDLLNGATDFYVIADIPESGPATIVSNTNYTIVGASIDPGKASYFVNLTGGHDANQTVYINRTFTISAVNGYERTLTNVVGTVEVQGYTSVLVDPLLDSGDFQIEMLLEPSVNGTAIAQVIGPEGRFTELNVSAENYTVIVPTEENMTFSASESTDPNSPDDRISPDANFTWVFNNATKVEMAYGIQPDVTFSVMGNYTGNLTIVEPGGNQSFRDFTLFVDGVPPVAVIENNITGEEDITDLPEGGSVRFFGGNSTDLIHSELKGKVAEWRWDMDGDGEIDTTGEDVEWIFEDPGSFTVNLKAVDQSGHESVNATMTVSVVDRTPPAVGFDVMDEEGKIVSTLTEEVSYLFDASATTDNHDALENLTFEWDFGDEAGATGYNVTHTYTDFGVYTVSLNVTDQEGNVGNLSRELVVEVDTSARPDLEIEPESLVIEPRSPEESSIFGSVVVSISLNVTNWEDGAKAEDVTVTFLAFRFGEEPGEPIPIDSVFYEADGVTLSATLNSLEPGEKKVVRFTWVTGAQGNYTLRVNVTDVREPAIFIGPDNTVETQIDVRQAFWVTPAIIAAAVGVIGGIPAAIYFRRRFRGRLRERITKK